MSSTMPWSRQICEHIACETPSRSCAEFINGSTRLYTLRFTSWNNAHPEATCNPKNSYGNIEIESIRRQVWEKFLPKGAMKKILILKYTQAISKSCRKHEAVASAWSTISLARLWVGSMPTANSKINSSCVTLSPARKEEMLLSESCPYHTNQDPCNCRKNLPCHDLSLITFNSTSHVRLFQILQATPEDHSKALALSPNVSAVAGISVFLEPNGKWRRTVDHSQAPKKRKRTSITSITEACDASQPCPACARTQAEYHIAGASCQSPLHAPESSLNWLKSFQRIQQPCCAACALPSGSSSSSKKGSSSCCFRSEATSFRAMLIRNGVETVA